MFLHDNLSGATTRVSVDSVGTEGNNDSLRSAVSADGRLVVYESEASNLVAGDSNRFTDVFLRDTEAPLPPPPPLGDPRAFARLPLRLTDTGQRVLNGRADRVALLGLDRWLGGTHLTPAAAWRWDPAARLLVRPAAQR